MTHVHGEMTGVSLFDGIGGFPRALSLAGIRTVAAVEIDRAAAGVAGDHFPDAQQFDDVTEVTVDDILTAGFCPVCGIICAGWPCQDLSLAGRRLGLGGARSGLFWEIVRLARGLRPRWLLLENVPGLLSAVCSCPGLGRCEGTRFRDPDTLRWTRKPCAEPHGVSGGDCGRCQRRDGRLVGKGRCMDIHGGAMGAVLGSLGELGYGFAYRVLDAQHFGVPQRRRRVVIVGCLGDWAAPAQVLLEPEGVHRDSASGCSTGPVVTALTRNGVEGGGGPDDNSAQGGHLIATTLKARDAKQSPDSSGTQTLIYQDAGTNVGPMGALRRGAASVTSGIPFTLGGEVAHALTSEGADASEDGTGRGTPLVTHTLTAGDGNVTGDGRGRGTPITAYALRADPAGVGQGHNTNFVAATVKGSERYPSHEATMPATPDAVRRLTPVECERLQGYPDGWTATSNGKAQADAPRYRQLGNSIAVPVFEWVARRIVAHEHS